MPLGPFNKDRTLRSATSQMTGCSNKRAYTRFSLHCKGEAGDVPGGRHITCSEIAPAAAMVLFLGAYQAQQRSVVANAQSGASKHRLGSVFGILMRLQWLSTLNFVCKIFIINLTQISSLRAKYKS